MLAFYDVFIEISNLKNCFFFLSSSALLVSDHIFIMFTGEVNQDNKKIFTELYAILKLGRFEYLCKFALEMSLEFLIAVWVGEGQGRLSHSGWGCK